MSAPDVTVWGSFLRKKRTLMAKPSRRIRNLLDRPDANDAPDKHAAATSTPILAAAPHQVRGRPTDKHMRSIRAVVGDARRVRVAAGVAAVFAFIATFVWAIVRESAPLGFIGGAVQALLVLGWALAALTFLGTGMLVAIRWGRSVTRSVPSRRRAGQFLARWAMDAHNLLGKGAAMTGRISQRAEIWPPLLCGPVAAASVLGWLDRQILY